MKIKRKTEPHISVTLLPEQVMPVQDSPQGSPPLAFHFVSCPGEFRLVYRALRTDAEKQSAANEIILKETYLTVKGIIEIHKDREQLKRRILHRTNC